MSPSRGAQDAGRMRVNHELCQFEALLGLVAMITRRFHDFPTIAFKIWFLTPPDVSPSGPSGTFGAIIRPDLLPGAILVLMLPLNAFVAWRERNHFDLRSVSRITAGRFGGTFVGFWILVAVTTPMLNLVVGPPPFSRRWRQNSRPNSRRALIIADNCGPPRAQSVRCRRLRLVALRLDRAAVGTAVG
jgi:hypothetical protein